MTDPVDLSVIAFDERGLVPVAVQDASDGRMLMLAWADAEAVRATLNTGYAHFHSRSRGKLWKKGESSGHVMAVVQVLVDCDADTLLYRVRPAGPACHTGQDTCFFRVLGLEGMKNEEQGTGNFL